MATRSELIANWAVTVAKLLAFKSKKYAEPYDKEVKTWSAKCASLEAKLGSLQAGNYSLKQNLDSARASVNNLKRAVEEGKANVNAPSGEVRKGQDKGGRGRAVLQA